jgi:hypothetical protein
MYRSTLATADLFASLHCPWLFVIARCFLLLPFAFHARLGYQNHDASFFSRCVLKIADDELSGT